MCRIVLDCICGDLGDLVSLGGLGSLVALAALHTPRKTGSWFTRSLFFSQLSVSSELKLLAVLPSKSNTKTTQGQSCSSND